MRGIMRSSSVEQASRSVVVGALVALAAAACNVLSGASDLQFSDVSTHPGDGGVTDGAIDGAAPGSEGGVAPDASLFDGGTIDGAVKQCPTTAPTSLLGVATPQLGLYQLTPETFQLAGGIASPTPIPIDDFDASFVYSMTYKNGTNPGAGLAFFVLAAGSKNLPCNFGPNLCTLGTMPGFAVVLRTSKVAPSDPDAPYVAVVDSQSFPAMQPTTTTPIVPSLAYSQVADSAGTPSPGTFHLMSISVRAGKVTASIDAMMVLSNVPIPNWVAGRTSTWGIGAATGQGNTFAERTLVGQVTFNTCP